MSTHSAEHSTTVLMRTFDAPVDRVFAAVADPDERLLLYTGSERFTATFEQADLRVGGRDVFRFGLGPSVRFRCQSDYHDVVPERRIVSTDIVTESGRRLWIAATTLEFRPLGPRTRLKVTAQTIWLDGADAVEAAHGRYTALLDNLERYLGGKQRFRPRPVTSD